jgi:hypothetical protein
VVVDLKGRRHGSAASCGTPSAPVRPGVPGVLCRRPPAAAATPQANWRHAATHAHLDLSSIAYGTARMSAWIKLPQHRARPIGGHGRRDPLCCCARLAELGMTVRRIGLRWVLRRPAGAGHDHRWSELARTLADVGFWRDQPLVAAETQRRDVAAGGHPFSCPVLDDVTFHADGENLAEGSVEDLLREMTPALRRFGVTLRVRTVSGNNDDGGYVVEINGRRCLVLDADDWRYNSPWFEATVRPLAVVNDLLAAVGTPIRVFTLYTGGNEGRALLLDPAVVDAVRRSGLVDDREMPELPVPDR